MASLAEYTLHIASRRLPYSNVGIVTRVNIPSSFSRWAFLRTTEAYHFMLLHVKISHSGRHFSVGKSKICKMFDAP